jgi:hypothetical protein
MLLAQALFLSDENVCSTLLKTRQELICPMTSETDLSLAIISSQASRIDSVCHAAHNVDLVRRKNDKTCFR